MKRSPLRSIGKRRKSKAVRRAEVVVAVRNRDISCRIATSAYMSAEPGPPPYPWTCGGPLDVHEIIPRSVWPDGDLVESNCVLICRVHHDWIGDHPAEAHRLGLHGFSWERK
jgi:hypothetical protein